MFLTPKEFALAVGVSYNTLKQHIYRKKVIKSGDFVDTDNKKNVSYINDQTNFKGLDLSKVGKGESQPKKEQSKPLEEPSTKSTKKEPKPDDVSPQEIIARSLELRKKRADAEKSERDNELKAIEIQKKRGELMPVELVRSLFVVNLQSVFRAFEVEADRVASIYCDVLGGDRAQLAEMAKLMRESLQKCIEDVKQQADEDSKAAIKEYSQVRSRGERK